MSRGAAAPALVVATGNPGKLREIREILAGAPFALRAIADADAVRMPEEGDDYTANAVAKARAVAEATGCAAIGDDSGLEVDALDGRPGPHSARYGGPGLDDAGRVAKLLEELGVASGGRGARFVCIVALARPDGRIETARGECEGTILASPRGAAGFGYDPVFQPTGYGVSMAELPASTKNGISHRGRALAALRPALERLISPPAPSRRRAPRG